MATPPPSLPPFGRPPPPMATRTASDGELSTSGSGDGSTGGAISSRPAAAALFPLGYKQGFNQWWTALPAAETERRVLSFIPYLQKPASHSHTSLTNSESLSIESDHANNHNPNPGASSTATTTTTTTTTTTDPWGPRSWSSRMVPLSGKSRALNEFSVTRPDDQTSANKLVIVHGYGAGLGFFYKNFEPLSRSKGWQLYALDLLGMGRSSRPPFRIQAKTREQQITEAEDWFVDSLEEWRAANKIDKMTLLGHSMGGYMAVCYALKYPGRLNKLILASPVGIPEDPYASQSDAAMSRLETEFTQDQEAESTSSVPHHHKPPTTSSGDAADSTDKPPRRSLPKWFAYLWDANISPFSFVRLSGPLGPRLVSGWTSRRFSHLPQDEALALHDYAYSLFRMRGSGEYALAYLLAPGAFARSPLIRRIGGLGRQTLPNGEQEHGFPVVFMYGQNDWMDANGGLAAKKKMDAVREKLLEGKSAADRARDRGSTKVVVVPKAGHHVYLDNPDAFNELVRQELDDL